MVSMCGQVVGRAGVRGCSRRRGAALAGSAEHAAFEAIGGFNPIEDFRGEDEDTATAARCDLLGLFDGVGFDRIHHGRPLCGAVARAAGIRISRFLL